MTVPWIGYHGAIKAPGKVTGDRGDFPILYIVIHGTGWPASFDYWVNNAPTASAVTYMIAKDGRIAQFESEASQHWGNGVMTATSGIWIDWENRYAGNSAYDPNRITISIEHEKHGLKNEDLLTPEQQAASFTLITDIIRRNDSIPIQRGDTSMAGGIIPHSSVNPVYRSYCPGPYPWDEMLAYVRANVRGVPKGWSDDGSTLKAPG